MIDYLGHEFSSVSLLENKKQSKINGDFTTNKFICNKCGVIVFDNGGDDNYCISAYYDQNTDYSKFIDNCDNFIIKMIIE